MKSERGGENYTLSEPRVVHRSRPGMLDRRRVHLVNEAERSAKRRVDQH